MTIAGHRTQAVVQQDGKLVVTDLPLTPGEQVEVIVFPRQDRIQDGDADRLRDKLRGSVLRDDDPFGPAAPHDDWEAMR